MTLPRWLAERQSAIVIFLAGALLPLAYAPIGFYPLALVSVAILFGQLIGLNPRPAFWRGYLFGVGFFGVGVSWVAVSMYRFGAMGAVLSGLATLLFVLFLALFPALMAWLSRRHFSRLSNTWQLLAVLPVLWVLLEWVRGWIMTGFPWLLLGYSQTDSPLAGLAPIAGVYGLSFAVAISAGLLVLLWRSAGCRRLVYAFSLLALWGVLGLLTWVEWSAPAGEPFRASLIQGNVPQNLKWRPEQRQPTIELYTRLTRENWSSRVVLWPETALPAFYHQAHSYLAGLAQEGEAQGSDLVLGLPVMQDPQSGRYYNSVVRAGEEPKFYHKQHLVPFGEYIPLRSVLGTLLDILRVPMANFSRGDAHQALLEVAGHKAGVSICYEDAFGEEVIQALPEAEMLINVSNDAWFGDSFAPHQHLQMARMRSMETARPMLRATNNGVSALIDHRGMLTAVSPQFQVFVLSGEVQARQGATPYALLGNYPVIIGLFLVLLLSGLKQRLKSQ